MIFGNAAWGFRELPLEEQLAITKRMGLSVLELGIANAPKDLPLGGDTAAVKALYEAYGISLVCAATGNDFTNGNRDDVCKIKTVIDMCADMGITYLRIFAGFSPVDEVVGEDWDNMISCLTEVAEYAKDKRVIPVVETHGGVNAYEDGVEHFHTVTTNPETLQKLLALIPENVGINYDPANLYAVGITRPDEVYQAIKDRVCYIHMKDFAPLPSGHLKPDACGTSNMDWKEILSGIGERDIIALFEYENTEDVEDGCRASMEFIQNIR
ncbi:MAG: sugar phosphate isomerase/epimerase [Ruminococcaceae bacterium]|nr:sugar phosphate isomerase/epimerase [Oscillospiraceae bacterium]